MLTSSPASDSASIRSGDSKSSRKEPDSAKNPCRYFAEDVSFWHLPDIDADAEHVCFQA